MTDTPQIGLSSAPEATVRARKPKVRLSPLGRKVLIRGENKRQFEEMRAQILKEIDPYTKTEMILCEKFITACWKHQRAVEMERNLLSAQNSPEYTDSEQMVRRMYKSNHPSKGEYKRPDKRIRNIKKVQMDSTELQTLIRIQLEFEKSIDKLLGRIREEQKLRKNNHE